jgi:hypothetical protein
MMKEDATAKELERLLRDALNTTAEPARGATPLLQLKTVPLQVQHIPVKAQPAPKKAEPKPEVIVAPKIETASDSIPELADRLAPESVPPRAASSNQNRSRSSRVALLAMGALAVAATGAAFWFARERAPMTSTAPVTAAAAPEGASTEGAVGISISARPLAATAAPTNEAPKAEEAKPAPVAAPPPVVAAPTPSPAARAEKPEAKEAKADVKEPKAETKPKHSTLAAKVEKAEASPKPERKEPAPAPASPPNGGGSSAVDALNQQLKGAIP